MAHCEAILNEPEKQSCRLRHPKESVPVRSRFVELGIAYGSLEFCKKMLLVAQDFNSEDVDQKKKLHQKYAADLAVTLCWVGFRC